jgi:hypothetical protein
MWWMLWIVGCATEPAAPPAPEAPACDLALEVDALAGKSVARLLDGDKDPDLLARAQFFKDGETLKVKYNTRALTDMYTYTCKKESKEFFCQADNVDLEQWCRTLIANKGACSGAEIANLTGAPLDAAQKAAETINAAVKKLSPEQMEKLKTGYSLPSNQLRGVLHVKVNPDTCRLTMRDNYQTMERGELREYENVVGSARFVPVEKELVFEHCGDPANFVALAAPDAKPNPGESAVDQKVGTPVDFRYVGAELVKAEAGCTYSMDVFRQYEPVTKGQAVAPDADGKLTWATNQTFDKKGKNVVHLYRYKDCGKGAELAQPVSCQWVNAKAE